MKRFLSIALALLLMLSLCACGSTSYEPKTTEEKIAYEILRQAVPDCKKDGIEVIACGPCKVYENYEGRTLVCATVYDSDAGYGSRAYGLFDGTEIKEYIWFGSGIDKMEELRKATEQLEYTEFDVSADVCAAVGIKTYREMWESIATPIACSYLMEYMNYLKNPYTIQVNSVNCYVKPYGIYQNGSIDDKLYFTVNYTAENNVGGKVTSTIGNTQGISIKSSNINSAYAAYFVEDETYAKKQADSFALDSDEIQAFILKNY